VAISDSKKEKEIKARKKKKVDLCIQDFQLLRAWLCEILSSLPRQEKT